MSKDYIVTAEHIIDIPFHDVDALEVVWHGHYVKYFELARCELLRKIDYDYDQMRESSYAWPVVDLQLRFLKAATYTDKVKVFAGMTEYENRLKIEYLIENMQSGEILTKGFSVQVALNMKTRELELVTPEIFHEKIRRYL